MIKAILAILGVSFTAWSGSLERRTIQVILNDPSSLDWSSLAKAKLVAADILRSGEVDIHWVLASKGPGCRNGAISIAFSTGTPANFLAGAMGYSLPFRDSGTRITIFLDRLQPLIRRGEPFYSVILGHVLAHELTHVLQGFARHTGAGLMKAHWSEDDFQQMSIRPMTLTADDIQFIRKGAVRVVRSQESTDEC
jgi:hypothetical protein